jgi:hypothetical protein
MEMFTLINIQINKTDLDKVLLAFDKVEKSVQRAALRTMTKEAAMEYADKVKENILTQEYGDFGHPHKEWKKNLPHADDYWILLGTVLNSIQVRPVGMSPKMGVTYKVGFF